MAFLVTSVHNSASTQLDLPVQTPRTSTRRTPLVCHWIRDSRPGGRLVARWVADEEVTDNQVTDNQVADKGVADSWPQDAVIVRSSDRAVA